MSRAVPIPDPRIAPKEMIITRFKSAQQKRQQRDKEHGPKPTQAQQLPTVKSQQKVPQPKSPQTKSVTKTRPRKAKPQKSQSKKETTREAILIEDDHREYYPEKVKRVPGTRKVFLKPKQKSTMIARTNKRKFTTPKKGINPPDQSTHSSETVSNCKSPEYSELSMAEVIRMVEENDSLDEEDLMEILTCPSPVWWEEPPDDMYIEEAICSRKPEENANEKIKSPIRERCLKTFRNSVKIGNKIKTKDSNTNNTVITKTGIKKDDKFIKKSKKLENVLGNIKNKVSKDTELVNKETTSSAVSLQPEIKESSAVENKSCGINDISQRIGKKVKEIKQYNKKNNVEANAVFKDVKIDEENKLKLEKASSGVSKDLNSRDKELVLDINNTDIPGDELDSPDCVVVSDDYGKIIDVDDLDRKLDEKSDNIKKDTEFTNTGVKNNENVPKNGTIAQCYSSKVNTIVENASPVPKNMPPLTKRPKFQNNVSPTPNSYKSISEEVTESSSLSGIDIMDTISDTNIKFITDDDDIDEVSENETIITQSVDSKEDKNESSKVEDTNADLNQLAVLRNLNDTKSKDAFITVYKIMPNDEAPKPKNKFKNMPEYSNYVENLIQSETKDDIIDESLDNEIPDIPLEKGQLNSFFKICKNANRKRKRIELQEQQDIENERKSPKSITVAQEENVKYCLKCSSIFDTEECSYCLRNKKEVDRNEIDKFTCDKCDFVGDTGNVDEHLEEHNAEESKT